MSDRDREGSRTVAHDRARWAVLRIAVAAILVIHGVARAWLGIVDDFGGFLEGLPLLTPASALVLAWTITALEVVGGVLLAAGRAVAPLAGWFCLQLAAGILLVHGPQGWFVVGAGRNGAEYSVLLIVVLAVVGSREI